MQAKFLIFQLEFTYILVEHLTHFTDMLGASHSKNYSLWRLGGIATDGLKEIAEWGNTYTGEGEMKANVGKETQIHHMSIYMRSQ
jgi:hypothetical protein